MMIDKAMKYIRDHAGQVNHKYRQTYHLMPPVGWMNDPNGFAAIQEELHLFYQFHPYSSKWGPMHWGHGISKDGVVWRDGPVAIAPDEIYDEAGCFSGTSLLDGEELVLMYTGAEKDGVTGKTKQVQCIAVSSDFIHFEKKKENPVISEKEIPEFINIYEFRDPKIIKRNGTYYAIVAAKARDDVGQLVLFESEDKVKWKYKSVLLTGNKELGIMWECPDYFELDGYDVIIVSPIEIPEKEEKFLNYSSSICFLGALDWEKGEYIVESYDEIDQGLDFYAPQTALYKEQRIMVAWMQMWDRNIPTDELEHKWAGCMTFPRVLRVNQDRRLIQRPLENIYQYVDGVKNIQKGISEATCMLEVCQTYIVELVFSPASDIVLSLENKAGEKIEVSYDSSLSAIVFSRAGLVHKIKGKETHPADSRKYVIKNHKDKELKLELFADTSSLELFINGGEGVMSSRFFSEMALDIMVIKGSEKSSIKSAWYKPLSL